MVRKTTQIQDIVERLMPYKPESVILFGSHARGDARTDSDLDIVVVKRTKQSRPQRLDVVLNLLYPGKKIDQWPRGGIDVLVYTPEELLNRHDLGDSFVRRIIREGRVLYGREPLAPR